MKVVVASWTMFYCETSLGNFKMLNTKIPTLNKYIISNQTKFIMEINAFKEPLVYLFIMMWCNKIVTIVLACYMKTSTVCGII